MKLLGFLVILALCALNAAFEDEMKIDIDNFGYGLDVDDDGEYIPKELGKELATLETDNGRWTEPIARFKKKYKTRWALEWKKLKRVLFTVGKPLFVDILTDMIRTGWKRLIKILRKLTKDVELSSIDVQKRIIPYLEDLFLNSPVGDIDGSAKSIPDGLQANGIVEILGNVSIEIRKFKEEMIAKYHPRILDLIKTMRSLIIKDVSNIAKDMAGDVIRILVKGDIPDYAENSELLQLREDNGKFAEIWAKVKRAASKIPDVMKKATDKVLQKYKPKILAALKKAGEVAVESGQKIMIKIKNNIVHIFVGGKEVASSS